jgi:hypothetical protein
LHNNTVRPATPAAAIRTPVSHRSPTGVSPGLGGTKSRPSTGKSAGESVEKGTTPGGNAAGTAKATKASKEAKGSWVELYRDHNRDDIRVVVSGSCPPTFRTILPQIRLVRTNHHGGQQLAQSHQSSVSTLTRTSSMASAVAAYQSQENSLDGDSEGSCAQDRPDSSPFESPPPTLTPSRSQSPRSQQNKATLQSSTSNNSSSSASAVGNFAPTTNMTNSNSQPRFKPEGSTAVSYSNSMHQIAVQTNYSATTRPSCQAQKLVTLISIYIIVLLNA